MKKFKPAEQVAAPPPDTLVKTFLELQVHQIELDVQNEELRRAQLALDAAHARYFDLFDLAPAGYFTLSDKGLILEVNLTAVTFVGAAKSALVARPFSSLISPADTDRFYLFFRQLLVTGQSQMCGDLQVRKQDGTSFWAALQGNRTTDATGMPAINLILSDISARKQAEVSRAHLAAIIEFSEDCIISNDLTSIITSWNKGAENLFGYSASEMIGTSILRLIPVAHQTEEQQILDTIARGGCVNDFKTVRQTKAGRLIEVSITASPIKNVAGQNVGVSKIARDISEHKRAEAELLLQGKALHAAANAIVITDPTGNVVSGNPAFTALTGYAVSEVLGKNLRVLKSGEQDAAFYRQLWETIRTGQVWSGELINKRKDGSLYTEEMTITPVRTASGAISHFIAIKQDVTRRKQAEHALEVSNQQLVEMAAELQLTQQQMVQQASLRALGQMASGIAHDVNNSLSLIVGFSELLLKHPEQLTDQEKSLQYLQNIHTAGRDASDVVRRLREFGHQRAVGEIPTAVDLTGLVRRVIELTQPRWKDQSQAIGLTIRMTTDLREVPPIAGEESAIRELLTNLVFNAIDALLVGGTITLGTELDGEFVKLWVSDTGVGMPEEVRKRCFEPFFTTKGDQGTGLGLSMVHGIVRRHGGTVAIASAPGQGTTVTLRLPIFCAKSAFAITDSPAPLTRSLRVLVVDDEPLLQVIVGAYLTSDGHQVTTVSSGEFALPLLKNNPYDLVITDKSMPEISGEHLAMAIHALNPTLPVILMSGFGDLMKAESEIPPQISTILSKPITEASLREALAKVFPP